MPTFNFCIVVIWNILNNEVLNEMKLQYNFKKEK